MVLLMLQVDSLHGQKKTSSHFLLKYQVCLKPKHLDNIMCRKGEEERAL